MMGFLTPWYEKESSAPVMLMRYEDSRSGRRHMKHDIQKATAAGWAVESTETVPGHVNAGWVVVTLLLFWTIIIPLMALSKMRTRGYFVVLFERVAVEAEEEVAEERRAA